MPKLKVYGVNLDGKHRGIIATTSQREAAQMFRIPLGRMRDYGSETGNTEECRIALAAPGVPFASVEGPHKDYRRMWDDATD